MLKNNNYKYYIIKNCLLSIFFYIFIFSSNADAKEFCTADHSVCTEIVGKKSVYEMIIKNYNTYNTTVTIDFSKFENMTANVSFPYTITMPPKKMLRAFKFRQLNPNKPYNSYYNFFVISGSTYAVHDNNYRYTLPYEHGTSYKVIQGFNGKYSHYGEQKYSIDFAMPEGTEVRAAREGIVTGIKDDSSKGGWGESYSGFANYVYIEHSDGTIGGYIHLKKDGVKVKVGQKVRVGDVIALSGNTGWSAGPHLHFWVYKAINGKTRESFPIKFKTSDSDEKILIEGETYTAP